MSVLSAYIRLADSGIGCEPWPECHTTEFRVDAEPGITIAARDPNKGLRTLHRLMASVFGILAALMVTLCWWYREEIPTRLVPSLVMLLTIVLAIVGMETPDVLHPSVTLINLAGGMLLGALLVWQWLQLKSPVPPGVLPVSLTATVFLGVLSGAWVSGNFAAGTCQGYFSCELSADIADAFSLSRALTVEGEALQLTAAQPMILFAHYVIALLVAVVILIWAVRELTSGQKIMLLPIVLLLALLASVFLEPDGWGVMTASVHNWITLTLFLVVTYLVHMVRRKDL